MTQADCATTTSEVMHDRKVCIIVIVIVIVICAATFHLASLSFSFAKLASCLINAQPLPAHRPASDGNSLIGCTRPRPDR